LDEAARYYERASRAGMQDVYSNVARAGLATLRYERTKALALLDQLVTDPVGQPLEEVWAFRGMIYARQAVAAGEAANELSDSREAAASWRRAIQINPTDPRYYVNLGAALRDFGEDDEALRSYRKAVELAPDCDTAWSNIGVMLTERGRFAEAAKAFETALETAPQVVGSWGSLAWAYHELGRLDEAITAWKHVRELASGVLGAHVMMGDLYLEADRPDDAIEVLQLATRTFVNVPLSWCSLGQALARCGRASPAQKAFQQALQLDADCVAAVVGLARLSAEQGRMQRAESLLKQALQRQPDDPDLTLAWGTFLLGGDDRVQGETVLRSLGDSDLASPMISARVADELVKLGFSDVAAEVYQRAIARFPEDRVNSLAMARLLLLTPATSASHYDRALAVLAPHVGGMRNYGEFNDLYALALLRVERFSEGIEALDRCVELHGPDARTYAWRCIAYARLGDRTTARFYFRQGEQLRSKTPSQPDSAQGFLDECQSLVTADPNPVSTDQVSSSD